MNIVQESDQVCCLDGLEGVSKITTHLFNSHTHSLCPLHLEDEVVISITIQVLDGICSIFFGSKTHKGKTLKHTKGVG